MLYQKIQRKVVEWQNYQDGFAIRAERKNVSAVQNFKLKLLNLSYFNISCIFEVQTDRVEGGTHYS